MSLRSLRRLVVTIPLLVLGVPACEADSATGVCTLAGCDSGLTVKLNEMPEGPFSVELFHSTQPNESPIYRYDCVPDTIPCGDWILFKDFTGTRTNVRVTTTVGTATYEVTVSYRTVFPNGRRCGGSCRQAQTTINVPVP